MVRSMSESRPVPERFRPALQALIRMIAHGDAAAIRASPQIRVGEGDSLLWVRDYPDTVIPLPAEGWELADAIQVSGHPELWSVVVPLWTKAQGRSDLTLEATVEDRDENPIVRIDNIHVL
jgi:hypothetical protein